MRVFGLWHSGNGYSFADIDTGAESWDSLASAKASLIERYRNGYWRRDTSARVVNVDEDGIATLGVPSGDLCPCVSENTSIDLYPSRKVGRGKWEIGNEPYARLTMGPRGGVRVENY